MSRGLYFPIRILAIASGIDEKQIAKDVKSGMLRSANGVVWYRDAAQYVYNAWEKGSAIMYPPYSDDVDQSFAMRVLSLMDDEIAVENLNIEWKEKK